MPAGCPPRGRARQPEARPEPRAGRSGLLAMVGLGLWREAGLVAGAAPFGDLASLVCSRYGLGPLVCLAATLGAFPGRRRREVAEALSALRLYEGLGRGPVRCGGMPFGDAWWSWRPRSCPAWRSAWRRRRAWGPCLGGHRPGGPGHHLLAGGLGGDPERRPGSGAVDLAVGNVVGKHPLQRPSSWRWEDLVFPGALLEVKRPREPPAATVWVAFRPWPGWSWWA
jgi:hypothetical protein